jgi:hypothetical protein
MSPCRQTCRCAGLRLKREREKDVDAGLAGEWRMVNRWAVRDDTYMYCTVPYFSVCARPAYLQVATDGRRHVPEHEFPDRSNNLLATLVGIPSVQNMWRGLSRGDFHGTRQMAHQQVGVRWLTDGFHNPFLSMFGNRSSVGEVVCPTRWCRAGKPACLARSNQWQTGIECSTLTDSNFIRPHPIRRIRGSSPDSSNEKM